MSLLAAQRLIVIDVETTGWRPSDDAIVEIARVTIEHGAVTDRWSTLVQPGRPVPPDATRIHGISDAMLAGAPAPAEIARLFREACGGDTLVIHNAGFDIPFVNTMLRRSGAAPLYNPVLDTLGLARGLFGAGGNTLRELAEKLGIAHTQAHRALGDALATAGVLMALAPRWEQDRGVRSLAELAAATQDAIRISAKRSVRPPVPAGV